VGSDEAVTVAQLTPIENKGNCTGLPVFRDQKPDCGRVVVWFRYTVCFNALLS